MAHWLDFAGPGYIDVKVEAEFTSLQDQYWNGKIYNIEGEVYGDRFPSNETFIVDKNGTRLFIGVSGVDSVIARIAPQTELIGTAFEDMSSFNFDILFDENDVFGGVRIKVGSDYLYYSVDGWNEQFFNLDPASTETGTFLEHDD